MISGGEVELVLAAKDLMSPTLVTAALQVKNLEQQMKSMGTMSVEQIMELNNRLGVAMENFTRLAELNKGSIQQAFGRMAAEQNAVASSGASLNATLTAQAAAATTTAATVNNLAAAHTKAAAAAQAQGQSLPQLASGMSQVEGLAVRMIERLLILYALRESFNFVTGILKANEALVALSDVTGASVENLGNLEAMGERVGVPVDKFTTAVDTLNKRLAEMKMATSDSLQQIGLDFQTVFSADANVRINMIVDAIARLPSTVEQAKVAAQLFGTDAILPLIKHAEELRKLGIVGLDKETSSSLHEISTGFSDLYSNIKLGVVNSLAVEYEHLKDVWDGMSIIWAGGFGMGGKDFPLVNEFVGPKLPTDVPATGWERIAQLKAAAEGTKELTADQLQQLEVLRQLNLLTADNASSVANLNTEQFKKFMADRAEAVATTHEFFVQQAADIREQDTILMASYERQIAQLRAVTNARLQAYTPREQIVIIAQEVTTEIELAKAAYDRINSEKDRMRLIEETNRRRIDAEKQVLAIEQAITKESDTQISNEIEARQRNAERTGMAISQNSNLNPMTIDQANNPWVLLAKDMEALDRETRLGIDTTQRRKEIEDNFVLAMGGTLNKFSEGTQVFSGLAAAAAAAKKKLEELAQPPTDPSLITPWSRLVPKPITISDIGVDQFMKSMPQPIGPVNVNVSGVLDPITIKILADAVGKAILGGSNRPLPAR